jgi:inorganic pyrophosphatase
METSLETLLFGEDAPRLVNAVVEVPVGSRNKYEYEPDLGVIVRDSVLPGAFRYPADISGLGDLPKENLREIEQFFEVYKRLEGDEEVEIFGWMNLDETHELIRECAQAYARAWVLIAPLRAPIHRGAQGYPE